MEEKRTRPIKKEFDLSGQKFNKLTVIRFHHRDVYSNPYYECQCECGNIHIVRGQHLRAGKITSCGHCGKEMPPFKEFKFGDGTAQILKRRLSYVKARCYNEKDKDYKDYGGRGIKVCKEWLEDAQKFVDWSITHGFKEELTLDRINTNGDYCPENCRWITNKEQQRNRRNNVHIVYKGKDKIAIEWAEYFGVSKSQFNDWRYRGLTMKEIEKKCEKKQ